MCWSPLPHREAGDVFAEVAGDPETKVVIVTGTADAFCTEVDAESFAGVPWDRIWWEGKRLIDNRLPPRCTPEPGSWPNAGGA
jgi:enoyl-CoA hydratase/carnithine racemase